VSLGDLEMTLRISAVAVCCSRASARRFSRSRALEPSRFSDVRVPGRLAPTLGFLGFARRIGPSLLLTDLYGRAAIDDRLGEDAPVGKWAGRVLDNACERDGRGPDATDEATSWVKSG